MTDGATFGWIIQRLRRVVISSVKGERYEIYAHTFYRLCTPYFDVGSVIRFEYLRWMDETDQRLHPGGTTPHAEGRSDGCAKRNTSSMGALRFLALHAYTPKIGIIVVLYLFVPAGGRHAFVPVGLE